MANSVISEGPWQGWDGATEPEYLGTGMVSVADNVVFERGAIVSRPGFRAQFASAMGGPLSQGFAFTKDDGGAYLLLVAGDDRLYRWAEEGSAAPTLVDARTFARDAVQFARLDDYILITGATGANAGKLFRYRISDGKLSDAVGLMKPGYMPQVTLDSTVLSPLDVVERWSGDTVDSGAIDIPDHNFGDSLLSDQGVGQVLSSGWTVLEGPVSAKSSNGTHYLELDNAGSGVISANFLAVPAKTNLGGVGNQARYPLHFKLKFRLEGDAGRSVLVTLVGYDAGGREQLRQTQEFKTLAGSDINDDGTVHNGRTVETLFNFSSIGDDTLISKVKLILLGGDKNLGDDDAGPWVTDVELTAFVVPVNVGARGAFGFAPEALQASTSDVLCGQQHLVYRLEETWVTPATGADFSAIARVFFPVTFGVSFVENPVLSLGLRTSLTSEALSVPLVRYEENGQVFLTADLSVLPTTARTGVRYLEIVVGADVSFSGVANTGQVAWALGAFSQAGNLSVGYAPYEWAVVETRGEGAEQVESPMSLVSASLRSSLVRAMGKVAPLTRANVVSDNNGTNLTKLWLYRRGGTFTDGFFRKVAELPLQAPGGNAPSKEYVDNKSDLELQGADVLVDHDGAPFGESNPARAVSVHAGRVVVATATRLYLSRAETGARVGLYWNLSNDLNAPNVPEQGFHVRLPDVGGGKAVRLVPHLTRLLCLMERALFVFGGNDPLDFTLRRLESEAGYGCVGANAVTVAGGGVWFQSQDGLRVFDGENTQRVGEQIEPFLLPDTPLLCWHGGRLFVSSKGGSLTCDFASEGNPLNKGSLFQWSRWLLQEGLSQGVTGLVSGQSGLFVLTTSGQMYKVVKTVFGDTLTRGGVVAPVPLTVRGRGMGLDLAESQVVNLTPVLRTDEATATATFYVRGGLGNTSGGNSVSTASNAPQLTENAYTLRQGRTIARVSPGPSAQGQILQWEVQASALRVMLLKVVMELAERRRL